MKGFKGFNLDMIMSHTGNHISKLSPNLTQILTDILMLILTNNP